MKFNFMLLLAIAILNSCISKQGIKAASILKQDESITNSKVKADSPNLISKKNQGTSNDNDWFVESFKTMSFCRCVELGNNNKFDLGNDDVSCRYPDWLYSEGEIIDSLALAVVKKIKLDSIERAKYSVAEGMEGKHVMSHCLKFYQSKELDVIAKRRNNY